MRYHDAKCDADNNNYTDDLCRYCKLGPESTYHTLAECEKHTLARFLIWGVEKLEPPYHIKMVSGNFHAKNYARKNGR